MTIHDITRHIIPLLLPLAMPLCPWAQQPSSETEEPAEDDIEVSDVEGDERTSLSGPVEIPGEADDIDIPVPSFIHQNANHIIMNGADWSPLRRAFEASSATPVSVVMIGDSHIQADISSGTTRELLQYDFGNAGRGLVAPLKISGTNEPTDYVFQSRNSWIPAKLMSSSWRQTVGFTGTSIRPSSQTSELTIGTSERDDYNPFSSVTIFHSGRLTVRSVTGSDGQPLQFRAIPSHDYTQILLPSQQTRVTVDFSSAGDLTVFGASLSGDRPGVFYHAIGNNGAAYETYNRIGNVGAGIAPSSRRWSSSRSVQTRRSDVSTPEYSPARSTDWSATYVPPIRIPDTAHHPHGVPEACHHHKEGQGSRQTPQGSQGTHPYRHPHVALLCRQPQHRSPAPGYP